MRFHNRGEGLGKKQLRPLEPPILAIGRFQGRKRPLVNPRQFQRLEPEPDRPTPQLQSRQQARAQPLFQVDSQGRHILL
jgi:hypothetical protein